MTERVIALAGNPNTGKSTVFNKLTGLRQHTGNWPGKTVGVARGEIKYMEHKYTVVDLPGTYSLLANSAEEEVARDFIWLHRPDVTVVVTDATNLERNLNLVLQVMEVTPNTVVCVNLIDEARRKGLSVDIDRLSRELGIPAVATAARTGEGLEQLLATVDAVARGKLVGQPIQLRYSAKVEREVRRLQAILTSWRVSESETRWIALRLLEGDEAVLSVLERYLEEGGTGYREFIRTEIAG
jgi:ferrous iron transport protein B